MTVLHLSVLAVLGLMKNTEFHNKRRGKILKHKLAFSKVCSNT